MKINCLCNITFATNLKEFTILTYFAVLAIYCFKCDSYTSWSACDLELNKNKRKCTESGQTRCLAVMERENPRSKIKYIKKCATRLENPCHDKRVEDCQATLCDKDLCNFALTPTATLIASAYRCKECNSTISWADCDYHAVEVFCGAGFRKCFKLEFKKSGKMQYTKGCTVPLACGNSSRHMPDANDRNIQCCGQHICNEARTNSAPVVFFGALFFVSIVFVLTP